MASKVGTNKKKVPIVPPPMDVYKKGSKRKMKCINVGNNSKPYIVMNYFNNPIY